MFCIFLQSAEERKVKVFQKGERVVCGSKLTCSDKEEDDRDYLGLPRFVTGLKSLAATLKVSLSTVSRWKAKGLLDTVTFQDGKSVFFDVYGVLELLRVSNQKGKYNQSKYNNKN